MVGKGKMAVVILHPDFEGDNGIEAAKDYADRMVQGAKEIAKQAAAAGDTPEAEINEYLAGFRYVVRRLPKDLV